MKVYIGIPFYGGACAEFVSSLLKTHAAFHLAGFTVEVDMHTNCSILPKARNEILARFLASGFDKLLFLDTDMVWSIEDVFKLIKSEHEFCGLDYRKKSEELEMVSHLTGRERDGWQQAFYVGAGVLCLDRSVVEKMTQHHAGTRYVSENGEIVFALFDFLLKDGRYYGEDATFCHRWLEIGGDISILKGAKTKHIGHKNYEVN